LDPSETPWSDGVSLELNDWVEAYPKLNSGRKDPRIMRMTTFLSIDLLLDSLLCKVLFKV
jgi:hypothetical protein